MKNMIKFLNLIILNLIFSSNISSMQESNIGSGYNTNNLSDQISQSMMQLPIPNELLIKIVKFYIESKMNSVQGILDVNKDALKEDVDRVTLICKEFSIFQQDVKNIILAKLELLRNDIKNHYQNLTKDELDKKLFSILNERIINKAGLIEAVKLIMIGADVNIHNFDAYNTLMTAIILKEFEIAKLLINSRTKLNDQNHYGQTALMLAVKNNNINIVKTLIKAGADPEIKDEWNDCTALDLAENHNHDDIAKLLRSLKK